MRTHVLALNSYDDIHSVLDRLKWVKTDRVLLILPQPLGVFGTELDFVLIDRLARANQVALGIVTKSLPVAALVRELGIPVFLDQEESRHKAWGATRRKGDLSKPPGKDLMELKNSLAVVKSKQSVLNRPWWRAWILLVAVASLIVLVAVLVPHARILIHLNEQIQMLDLTLTCSSEIRSVDLAGRLPVYTKQVTISVEGSKQVSSTITTGITSAQGILEVRNESTKDVEIPRGTVFLLGEHPGLVLSTVERGFVSAGQTAPTRIPVRCGLPGTACNLQAGLSATPEGSLAEEISADLITPLSGGKDDQMPAPGQQDYEELEHALLDEAKQQVEQITGEMQSGDLLLLDETDPSIFSLDVVSDGDVGVPANTLHMELSVTYEFHYIDKMDIRKIAQMVLDAGIPEGWTEKQGTLYWEQLSPARFEDGKYSISLKIARIIQPVVNFDQLAVKISGRTRKRAMEIIRDELDLVKDPVLELPFLSIWMPLLPSQIEVSVP